MTLELVEVRGGLAIEDDWKLRHRHALGRAGQAFIEGLDESELIAARCPSCRRLLLPPRSFCERCFQPTELESVEARAGELMTYTVVRQAFADSPPVPFAVTYVLIDGVDTALGMLLDEDELSRSGEHELVLGSRMEIIIREQGFGIERVRSRKQR